jgi:hypothetical protein
VSEATLANRAAEGGIMGEEWPKNFAESGDFHVTFGFFYMPRIFSPEKSDGFGRV